MADDANNTPQQIQPVPPTQPAQNPVVQSAPAQPQAVAPQPTVQTALQSTVQDAAPAVAAVPVKEDLKAAKEKKKKKKTLFILLGAIGFVFFMVFSVVFFMLSQGGGNNPLLQLFGLSEEELYPFLINMVNLFFGLFVFITFLIAVIGAFMTAMAKKEDKSGKKKGMVMLIIGMILFMMFAVTWAASYFYLQEKRAQYATDTGETTQFIQTDPESVTNLTAPAVIQFDASQLPVDKRLYTIIAYRWDFGDGAIATGPTVSHRYTSKGENDGRYLVTLTVSFRDNKTSEESTEVFTVDVVFVNEKVNASFTADPASGSIPLSVHFDASESLDPDGEIVAYDWDLDGDGTFDAEGVSVDYTYEKYGTYAVKLRVTDNNGESNSATTDIVVSEGNRPTGTIQVDLEEEDVLYVGKSYLFNAEDISSPNGSIENYEWEFGDGSNVTKNKSAQHTYSKVGTYTVTLKLTDEEGATGQVASTIEVITPESVPVAVITTDQEWSSEDQVSIQGQVPFTVNFSATSSSDSDDNIINYEWDVDGDTKIDGTGEEYEYTYQEAGIYNVVLYVEDSEDNQSEATIQVIVNEQDITAELSADTLNGEVSLTVNFDASGSSYPSGSIVNYLWDFGNSVTRYDDATVSYIFNEVGTFTVNVTAIASDGKQASDSIQINVLPISLSACFTTNVSSGKAPLTVTFNSCSTGSVTDYKWNFGDGDISYARKPTHTFENPGTYTIKLTVSDNDGFTDTYTGAIAVQN